MAVKIRLARRGRKKMAMYDIVIADARAPRDGKFIEKIGTYNPNTNPASIDVNNEKALKWIMNGAQPTDTVRAILSYIGVMMKKHLQVGVNKRAITQEQADIKFDEWMKGKETKIQDKVDSLTKAKDTNAKSRQANEIKIKEARMEVLQKKQAKRVTENTKAVEAIVEESKVQEKKKETLTKEPKNNALKEKKSNKL